MFVYLWHDSFVSIMTLFYRSYLVYANKWWNIWIYILSRMISKAIRYILYYVFTIHFLWSIVWSANLDVYDIYIHSSLSSMIYVSSIRYISIFTIFSYAYTIAHYIRMIWHIWSYTYRSYDVYTYRTDMNVLLAFSWYTIALNRKKIVVHRNVYLYVTKYRSCICISDRTIENSVIYQFIYS